MLAKVVISNEAKGSSLISCGGWQNLYFLHLLGQLESVSVILCLLSKAYIFSQPTQEIFALISSKDQKPNHESDILSYSQVLSYG